MLCIPLITTGIFHLIEGYNHSVYKAIGGMKKTAKPNVVVGFVIYIVGQFIPLCTQLGSLVFGHIRK